MHTSVPTWLALSAALLPTASAFYPYQYGNDAPPSADRVRRTPSNPRGNANANTRSITLPLHRVPRQNGYNIVNSNEPKQAHSVAIDQDGNDLSYMVSVTFGDSKEKYHLLLDSAASNTWVMGSDCSSEACKTHNTLGPSDSKSLKTDTKPFSVTYGTGSVKGVLASDTLHIGPLSPSLTFGLATSVSSEFRSYPMDGILGIGRGVKSTESLNVPQVMDVLASSSLIGAKLYGIHLSRNSEGKLDGELNLGEVNKDRFSGNINYLPALDNDRGFWEVAVADASVDGKSASLTGRSAIIDTGTSYILMPKDDALALHKQIPGFAQDGETFSVPCETTAVMQFSFGKTAYNISTADWKASKLSTGLCGSKIIGRQTFSATQWLVGDVFLKNVYSVFDFDNKQVGFGVKGESQANANSASASAAGESTMGAKTMGATATNSGSAAVSQTAGVSRTGGANPTAAAESSQQGQKGAAARTGQTAVVGLTVVAVLFALFV